MARQKLSADKVAELNYRGPFTGIGDRIADIEYAGYDDFQFWKDPAATSTTYVHAAVTDNGAPQTITTGITNPDVPRALTVTFGGTAGDIKAITVTVTGTDYDDAEITEDFLATVDTAGTVQGSKAFKTVTSIYIPAHDGTGATTAVGINDKLGFKKCLQGNTVYLITCDGVYETTRPTVATSASVLASNTIDPNTALNGARDFMVLWKDMRGSDLVATV